MKEWMEELRFDAQGLIPAVIQDAVTREVLMVAYMNAEALAKTLETGRTHFWSRSRRQLWRKGDTSGHVQYVKDIAYDCDGDALLIQVEQTGAACHTGNRSCFYRRAPGNEARKKAPAPVSAAILGEVYQVLLDRKANPPAESYTARLMAAGKDRILKKIGEEAGEVIIAAKNDAPAEIIYETADLWFHSLLVLAFQGIAPEQVYAELARRRK